MEKTFDTAEEARAIMYDINDQLERLPYNPDLSKFCYNICDMVKELSKLEVYTRRTPPRSRYHIEYNKKRETIRAAMQQLDNYILMHRLMA
jgi:type II secretory ATPase GspE/PulE/Tfp pilus assembly ATPase PilB-like protein